jgi:hypothetical protein
LTVPPLLVKTDITLTLDFGESKFVLKSQKVSGHVLNVDGLFIISLAVILNCVLQAIQFIRGKNNSPSMSSIAHSSHMDIFQVDQVSVLLYPSLSQDKFV